MNFFFQALWCACFFEMASCTTYYVSSSLGKDSNSGLSPALPWQSLTRAFSTSLMPGDAVLLRQGDSWMLDSPLNTTAMQGTVSLPIILSSYADDQSSLERPVVGRSPTSVQTGMLLNFHNACGLNVSGIEFVGAEVGLGYTFDAASNAPPPTGFSNFTIEDCVFRAQKGVYYNASTGSWWGSAIAFAREGTVGVTASSVRIAHCIFTECDQAYTNNLPQPTFSPDFWTRAFVDGLEFNSNAMVANSYNVLFLDTTTAVNVQSNVFLRDTPPELFVAGTTDIIMGSLDASCSIDANEISWRGEYNASGNEGPDGCAIDFETSAVGTRLSGNYISHSWGAGVMVFGHTVGSKNIALVNNILTYDGCLQTRDDHGAIAFMKADIGSSGIVNGNVIKTCPGIPGFYINEKGAADGFSFANNTVDDGSNSSVTVGVVQAPIVTRTNCARNGSAGSINLQATSTTPGSVLRYTVDGSRPTTASSPWPNGSGGVLSLPPRTTAVFVKAFPSPTARSESSSVTVESPVAGDIFSPTGSVGCINIGA